MAARRKENAVISVPLITTALEEAEQRVQVETSLPRPPVKLDEAVALELSFKNLLRIENLNLLKSLKKLQIDNNSIARIENLECLPHLVWLDLSFNRIKKIEGLSHLKHLKDLTLFNNEITVVEGLDGCTSLQCLSLGNNLIEKLDSVLQFRRLPSLEALTLEGNPLCKPSDGSRDNYQSFCHAFLPKLKYLDYRLITAAEKAAARDGGVPAEKLAEVEEKSAQEERAAAAAAEKAALVASLAQQNLEMAVTFPDELFDDEPEFQKLRAMGMPGLDPLLKALAEALAAPSADLRDLAGDKDKRIRDEIGMFDEAVADAVNSASAEASAAIDGWMTSLKHAVRDVKAGKYGALGSEGAAHKALQGAVLELIASLKSSADALSETLMRREIQAHETVESMLDVFDSAMSELRAAKLAQHDLFFRALEGQVTLFGEGMQKHAEKLMSDLEADRLPHGLDEELTSLLGDKEALMGVLGGSAEARVAKILKRESEMKQREEKRCNGAVVTARQTELARNRARVVEVRHIVNSAKKRAEEELLGAIADDEDGDGGGKR